MAKKLQPEELCNKETSAKITHNPSAFLPPFQPNPAPPFSRVSPPIPPPQMCSSFAPPPPVTLPAKNDTFRTFSSLFSHKNSKNSKNSHNFPRFLLLF